MPDSSITRRRFIRIAASGAVGLSLPAGGQRAFGQADPDRRPNVLFVVVDDLNDWIGCLGGHPNTLTPNMDRLAQRGVLFSAAHCPAPICNPSRTSVLTGLYPSTTGIYGNDQPFPPHLPDVVTLPTYFRAHDYCIASGGKVFHHGFSQRNLFDEKTVWDDVAEFGTPNPVVQPLCGIPGFPALGLDWGPLDVTDDEMGDGQLANWTIRQLSRSYDRPFFTAVGFYRPHMYWCVPRQYFEPFPSSSLALPPFNQRDLDDVPPGGLYFTRGRQEQFETVRQHGQWANAVAAYLASIHFVDAQLGKMLDALDASPYADNTIIVLWGDNGYHLGEKHHWYKLTLWEEATRAPLMIVAPGVTAPGGICPQPVSMTDLFPTLVELCGLPEKEGLDGRSLVPLLKDPGLEWERPALIWCHSGNRSARTRRWRYTQYRDGGEELFDHATDEHEWRNLAAHPNYRSVKADLARWFPVKDADEAPTYMDHEGWGILVTVQVPYSRMAEAVRTWDPNWRLEFCADFASPGLLASYGGRPSVLRLHPGGPTPVHPCRISADLPVPQRSPRLELGLAPNGHPPGQVRARVTVGGGPDPESSSQSSTDAPQPAAADAGQVVFENELRLSWGYPQWFDFTVDLSAYAGRTVHLSFESSPLSWGWSTINISHIRLLGEDDGSAQVLP